ncbi:MAG TPA: hypothetical protein VGB74_01275 [Actinoplanes sp.]
MSALGAVLTARGDPPVAEKFGPGGGQVPDPASLPTVVFAVVQDIYGTATSDLFLVAPMSFLAVIVVLFLKEKPLSTLSGDERREQKAAPVRSKRSGPHRLTTPRPEEGPCHKDPPYADRMRPKWVPRRAKDQDGRRPTEVRGEGGSAQPSRPTSPDTHSWR